MLLSQEQEGPCWHSSVLCALHTEHLMKKTLCIPKTPGLFTKMAVQRFSRSLPAQASVGWQHGSPSHSCCCCLSWATGLRGCLGTSPGALPSPLAHCNPGTSSLWAVSHSVLVRLLLSLGAGRPWWSCCSSPLARISVAGDILLSPCSSRSGCLTPPCFLGLGLHDSLEAVIISHE